MAGPQPHPLAERIRSAATNLTVAGAAYDIWWTYKSHDTRPKFLPGMESYSEFFRYDEEVQFRAVVVGLFALFDGRRDTSNFRRLLYDSGKAGTPLPEVEARLAATAATVEKVAALRHNLFAHRNHGLSYEDVYKAAQVTPNELRALLDECRAMLNDLGAAHGVAAMDFNPYVTDHITRLLTLIQPTAE